jgi:uncharacterized membrane protein YkoI
MRTLFFAALILAPGATLAGQAPTPSPHPSATPTYKREVPAALAAQAKVAEDSAVALALARVPGGQVEQLVLENEDGKFIYSLDIKVPGKSGIEEVHVDALNGRILAVEHEP